MVKLLSSYEVKQAKIKKVLRIINRIFAILFTIISAMLLFFNGFLLIAKATSNSEKTQDFAYVGNCYFVPITSSAWSKFYSKHSLIVAEDVNVNYEYLMLGENLESTSDERMIHDKRMNDVYLIKIVDGDEISYTVAKVESKVIEGVVFEGGMHVSYDCVLGVVRANIPAVSILQNLVFILIFLFLLVLYVATLIIFSYTDIGFDMLFEKEFKSQMRRNKTFAFENRDEIEEDKNIIKTDEEKVNDLIIEIISDSTGVAEDKEIPLSNIEKALQVISEQNFTSKSKMFVYLSALNLLNAYVKKDDCVSALKNKYFFKKYVQNVVEYVSTRESEDVKIFTDGSAVLIECLGMQFSFHGVKFPPEIVKKDWSGVKLQPYANKIFELLYETEFLGYSFSEPSKSIQKYIDLIENAKN